MTSGQALCHRIDQSANAICPLTGMVKLQSSMNEYVKWLSRRTEGMDREKGVPAAILGRSMIAHGEDFDNDSEFGNCLIGMLISTTPAYNNCS